MHETHRVFGTWLEVRLDADGQHPVIVGKQTFSGYRDTEVSAAALVAFDLLNDPRGAADGLRSLAGKLVNMAEAIECKLSDPATAEETAPREDVTAAGEEAA